MLYFLIALYIISQVSNIVRKRAYAQLCPLARALDAVGERWTLLLVRNLLVGPLRYSELLESLPGITTNLLAKRLKELTQTGILETKSVHGVTLYRLSERGRALEAAILALAEWGEEEAVPENGARNLRWAMLGIRRRYRGGMEARIRIVCSEREQEFLLEIEADQVRFLTSFSRCEDLAIEGGEDALFALFYGKKTAKQLLESGAIELRGSRKVLREFLLRVA